MPRIAAPLALVVSKSDITVFRQCRELFKDRGEKNPAKALSSVLLGYDGLIPVIDGNYTSSGRLRQGIRTLLEHAAAAGETTPYVIGVEEQMFDEIARAHQNNELHASSGSSTNSSPLPLQLEEGRVPCDAVAQVDCDLDDLLLLPEPDVRSQVCSWSGTVEPHVRRATGCLFRQVQKLLGGS
jgi:hypothetical protein